MINQSFFYDVLLITIVYIFYRISHPPNGKTAMTVVPSKRLSTLVIAVTAAYQHPLSVPIDERGHLFGLPLSQHLQLTPSHMEAWLAIYKAGQYRLTSQIKRNKRRQVTITQYLVRRTQTRCPSETI